MATSFIPLELTTQSAVVGGYSVRANRLWLAAEFPDRHGGTLVRDCLFDTGAPLSVIPFSIQQAHDLDWQLLSNPAAPRTHWFEVECDLGQIEIGLLDNAGTLTGPYPLVAKFPRSTPRSLRSPRVPLPILLGLNFIDDVRGEVQFQCHQPFDAGTIFIP